jgi:hypothetical protein
MKTEYQKQEEKHQKALRQLKRSDNISRYKKRFLKLVGSNKTTNLRCPYKHKKECKELNTLTLSKTPCKGCVWYNNGIVESRGYEILDYIINSFKRITMKKLALLVIVVSCTIQAQEEQNPLKGIDYNEFILFGGDSHSDMQSKFNKAIKLYNKRALFQVDTLNVINRGYTINGIGEEFYERIHLILQGYGKIEQCPKFGYDPFWLYIEQVNFIIATEIKAKGVLPVKGANEFKQEIINAYNELQN